MKLLVIDTIRGGNDTKFNLFQVAAVVYDTINDKNKDVKTLPKIDVIIDNRKDLHLHGSAYKVLSYNNTIDKSMDPTLAISKEDAIIKLDHFILQNFDINNCKKINIAAKNPQNDLKFIEKHLGNAKINSLYHPRLADPAILFHINEMDEHLPSLEQCLERIGSDKFIKHDALDNCYKLIKLFKTKI